MTKLHKMAGLAPAAILLFATANAETKNYDIADFTRISASAGVEVEATVGGEYSVRAEGAAENIERLKIKKSGSTLKIGRERTGFNFRWRGGAPTVYVSLPALEEANTSSGAEFSVTGVSADRFYASASSGSELELEGNCSRFDADASTGAVLDAEDLICRDVEIDVSTGAEAKVHASESIDASASTGGDVRVYGSPQSRDVSRSLGGDVDIE